MDSKGKRRGFMKGKLVMSFYRAGAKPPSPAPYSSRDQFISPPKQKVPAGSTTTSVDFIIKHDQKIPQPKPKVSFFIPDNGRDYYRKFDDLYGVAGDDSVDLKAASYISTVQERFKLERANTEYKKLQDVQH